MQGAPEVIERLNEALRGELIAINQYFLHASLCKHWGYLRLHKHIYNEAMEEMRHAEQLINRILSLEGAPVINQVIPGGGGERRAGYVGERPRAGAGGSACIATGHRPLSRPGGQRHTRGGGRQSGGLSALKKESRGVRALLQRNTPCYLQLDFSMLRKSLPGFRPGYTTHMLLAPPGSWAFLPEEPAKGYLSRLVMR